MFNAPNDHTDTLCSWHKHYEQMTSHFWLESHSENWTFAATTLEISIQRKLIKCKPSQVWTVYTPTRSRWGPLWQFLHNIWWQHGVPAAVLWCRMSSLWWSQKLHLPPLPLQNYFVQKCCGNTHSYHLLYHSKYIWMHLPESFLYINTHC